MSDTLIRLAGLFECESAAGNRYFTGLLNGGVKLVMLKNNYKQADNEPDWNLYLTERQRQGVADSCKAPAEVQQPKPRKRRVRRSNRDDDWSGDPRFRRSSSLGVSQGLEAFSDYR